MPTNIPLGTYVSDGVRTGPLYSGAVPSSLIPFNPNMNLSYSSYSEYGPGIQLSTQATWNITPNAPNTAGGFTILNNLVAPTLAASITGAGNLTLRGDNNVTLRVSDPSGVYVQFDWPRVPTVTITGAVAGNRHVTIFGYDWYGNPLQQTYIVNAIGTYPNVTVGPNGSLSIPVKSFYQITQVSIDGALGVNSIISLGAADIFGLPFLVMDAGDITGISWAEQSDLSTNTSVLSSPTIGKSQLLGGTVEVYTSAVTPDSNIALSISTPGGTLGFLSTSNLVPGSSFTISSLDADGTPNALDTSVISWEIINPNGQYPSTGTRIPFFALDPNITVVFTSQIQAGDIVQFTMHAFGVSHTESNWRVNAIIPGQGFTVISDDDAETSSFDFAITPRTFPSGTAQLGTGGSVFVPTDSVTPNSVIMLTMNTPGGTTGLLSAPSGQIFSPSSPQPNNVPPFGFTIQSGSNTDTSTVNWSILRLPAGISQGTAKLVNGVTPVINTPAVIAGSTIILGYNTFIGTVDVSEGYLLATNITDGVSFRVTAAVNNAVVTTDQSSIYWAIYPPGYSLTQSFTPAGAFVPGDQTFPPTAFTGDVRGLYAPSSPSDGVSVLKFTAYIAGADNWINQVSNEQIVAKNSSPPQPVVGVAISPLTPADLYGTPEYFTGTSG
jgi:hypothetical protein